MARTPAQRGRLGNWLVESRMARGWDTQEKARAEIERLTGWRIAQSVYAEWESGRRVPSEANEARLREFYGVDTAPTPGEPLVESVRLLVEELRAERAERVSFQADLLEALRELAQAAGRSSGLAPELPDGAPR